MKTKTVIFLVFVVIQMMGCGGGNSSQSRDFEMRVEKVEELTGVILKGLAVSGTVESGCIATTDEFVVKRDGSDLLKEIARILDIANAEPSGDEIKRTVKGDYVTLYLPDRKKGEVEVGDIAVSNTVSCQ